MELINEYEITIPLIQRDYAQGRDKEKAKANNFLNAILEGTEVGLNLDFVYGKANIEEKDFIPLDGQQRLTTLLLIHWYVSLEDEYVPNLMKFSYEVRSSTKDFIKILTNENTWKTFSKFNIKESIENASWFFLSWKNDPTVVALLNMLDLIEQKFTSVKLESLNNITFEYLDLNKFNLTDELYVKMNARGKPLTDFENFKSNFENYIEFDDKEYENRVKAMLDNQWLDIFWDISKNNVEDMSDAPKLADSMFYNFFYNITFNFYLENIDKLSCVLDNKIKEFSAISDKKKKNGFIEECSIFDFYKNVYENHENIEKIILILNNLIVDNSFNVFITDVNISQWQRARFYALSLGYINGLDDKEFQRWKRVSFNLINNQLIQSPDDMIKTVKALKKLSKNCNNDIYRYIKDNSDRIEYFSKTQREEECLKAALIEDMSNDWEYELKKAEDNWYLKGQIGFLIDFSNNNIEKFIEYRDKFLALWDYAKNNENNQMHIYQGMLTKGDYLVGEVGVNRTFCSFATSVRAKFDNWQKIFNSDKKLYLKELLDDNNFDISNIQSSLIAIIDNYAYNDWKSLFIRNKDYIKYCNQLQIRWYSDNDIYLLKQKQMNGTHSELYSWHLYKKQIKSKIFLPFKQTNYHETTSWEHPSIRLSGWEYENQAYYLDIKHDCKNNTFKISLHNKNKVISLSLSDLLNTLEFEAEEEQMTLNNINENDILDKVNEVCQILKNL